MNNKLLTITLLSLCFTQAQAMSITEKTPFGVYSESDEANDQLYLEKPEKTPCKKLTSDMKLAISAMCSLEPNPLACESDAAKVLCEASK